MRGQEKPQLSILVVGVTLGPLHLPEVGFAKMGLFTRVKSLSFVLNLL